VVGREAYTGEIFDVAISWNGEGSSVSKVKRKGATLLTSVLWTSRYSSRAFAADFSLQAVIRAASMYAERLWSAQVQQWSHQLTFLAPTGGIRETHGRATSRSSLLAAINAASRVFHLSSNSADGAHPRMPGWMSPANLTWGMCRLVQ
jgi:hypothetical protein